MTSFLDMGRSLGKYGIIARETVAKLHCSSVQPIPQSLHFKLVSKKDATIIISLKAESAAALIISGRTNLILTFVLCVELGFPSLNPSPPSYLSSLQVVLLASRSSIRFTQFRRILGQKVLLIATIILTPNRDQCQALASNLHKKRDDKRYPTFFTS